MSQSFLHIPALLHAEEVMRIRSLVGQSVFTDGKLTAALGARQVKENLQLPASDDVLPAVHAILDEAVRASPLFQIAALPKTVYPWVISKYGSGNHYGWHVDSPVMGQPPMRTDLAMTLFLSDPADYEGGELLIQTGAGTASFKPAQGDAVLYPCQFVHCVREVTRGERLAAVTWIQSHVKHPEQRQLLYQLNQIHASLYEQAPNAAETNLLLQTHSNLFRMWADL